MLVITVMVTSVIAYTSADSRDASVKQSGQSTFALAEAGVNQALAQLYSHYYASSGAANNNSTVYSSSWFTGTASQQSPSSSAACTATSTCMSWSVVSWTPSGGSGVTKGTLVLQGQGRVPNPTGGTALTRTVTENVDVRQPPQLVQTPSYWSELYTGDRAAV
jgi:Tfp pilus assembly protein PilE